MANLCIIPARGGSKRIPRKNIRDFLGKPIIAYSIEAALKSGLFDQVMVSTDDEEIAKVAKSHGAEVPFMRSNKNSDDYATTVDVISEVLESYKSNGERFDAVCCIYPTAPFINESILKKAFVKMKNGNFDSVFTVLPFSFPIQRALVIREERVEMLNKEHMQTRSQDLEKTFHDAGQFYWFNPSNILNEMKLWTDNSSYIEVDEFHAQDIDTEMDWKIAEFKFRFMNKRENNSNE
jgi:pseudaminic acid cytidylyltransferase